MTSRRAHAYQRVVATLHETGPAQLSPGEQAILRDAADTLLFTPDVLDDDALVALAEAAVLTDRLIDADRWTAWRAQQLLEDLWACGPEESVGRSMEA
jgi:hypothetical protein